jgi:urea transporter
MIKGTWANNGALAEQAARWIPDDITSTLQGLSQVIFVNNQISGLFIIAALYVGGGPLLATTALASTFVSTAIVLRTFKDVESVRNGTAGFNVCCIGAVFPVFVHHSFSVASFIAAVSCGVAATYLNLSIKRVFGAMPSLTFAFNAVIIACTQFAIDSPGALPQLPNTVENLLLVPLISVSQIFAVNNAYVGLLILIGAAIDLWGKALFHRLCTLW